MNRLALRFAARELRSGIRGFRIFLACLALGVAAIAAAGSTAEAFRQGLAAQAREILGGDLAVSIRQREFTPAEQAAFARAGRVAYSAGAQAMAQSAGGERRLVEVRGVGPGYPLAGQVGLQGARDLESAFAPDASGAPGAAVEPALLDRLKLKLGQRFMVGNTSFVARAALTSEPDRIGRFALGPRVLTRLSALRGAGLLQPGGLYAQTARIVLPPAASPSVAARRLRLALPGADLDIRDRNDAAPGARRLIDRLEYFLSFIGLIALLAGGLGVFGAVSSYLETRRPSIAALKALGADGALIRDIYLIQIGSLAGLGVGAGLAGGALAPWAIGWLVRGQLPIPALFAVYPWPLIKAGAFGLLSAAAFSLEPLARARATPPASLFRRDLSGRAGRSPETVAAALAGLGLAVLTLVTAPTPATAGAMIAGLAASLAVLWALGQGAVWAAGRLRASGRGAVRLGLANLGGPRSAARAATPAIGLGVGLLSCIVLIQSSLLSQVRQVEPRSAPAVVFTEIPAAQAASFDALIARVIGPLDAQRYLRLPFATARITALNGAPIDLRHIAREQRWAFDNDIGVSVIGAEPAEANIVEGRWWPSNYSGAPQVALDVQIARASHLAPGDSLTISILGRDIDAHVAVLRKVDWGGFGPDTALVIDAHALEGAGLRNIALAKMSRAQERSVSQALGAAFPAVNVISVREQLEAAAALFERLALAVRAAAAVAAAAGLLVLAGSISAGAQARAREAATLKVLGASRAQVLLIYLIEYGAVGLIAAAAGVILGLMAAWPVVTKVFDAGWSVDWAGLAAIVFGSAALTGAGGLAAAVQALSRRPASMLRAE